MQINVLHLLELKNLGMTNSKLLNLRKKGLFGKGSAKIILHKPQMLIDLEEKIDRLLKDLGVAVFFTPYDYLANMRIERGECSWTYKNPNKLDRYSKEYYEDERKHMLSIMKETNFTMTMKHTLKDDIEIYHAVSDLRTSTIFVNCKK